MNAISSFLALRTKQAAAREEVKSYVRENNGKIEVVRAHDRAGEDKTPDAHPSETTASDEHPPDELDVKKEKELVLWRAWKDGGQKVEDIRPLLASYASLIQSRMGPFLNGTVRIPPAAIKAEFYRQALMAFQTYDPDRGAALGTHLWQRLEKAKRFIYDNQNIARIPEHRITHIREFQQAQEILEAELGRPAVDLELAGHLKWSVNEVARMSSEIRRDLWTHSEAWEEDPSKTQSSKEMEVLRLVKYEISEDERQVYHWLIEKGVTSSGDIAKKTGFPIYKVSRAKESIAKRMKEYLK